MTRPSRNAVLRVVWCVLAAATAVSVWRMAGVVATAAALLAFGMLTWTGGVVSTVLVRRVDERSGGPPPATGAPVVILRSPYEIALLLGSIANGAPLLAGLVTSTVLAGAGASPWVIRAWGLLLLVLAAGALWAVMTGRPELHRTLLLPLALACAAYAIALLATSPRGYVAGAWVAAQAAGHAGRWWQYIRLTPGWTRFLARARQVVVSRARR